MQPTLLYRLYAASTMVVVPFAAMLRVRRLRKAGVPTFRAHEILGNSAKMRHGGTLIWFHAASVGESLSVLSLINAMGRACPSAHFLITSATPTSATLIEERKPARCLHQFAPLDAPGPLKRFLSTWRPDAAVLVESELWPNMLVHLHRSHRPTALVNARLSERSIARWAKRPQTARFLLENFALVLTQTQAMATALIGIGTPADSTMKGVDLKSLSAPLPVNGALLKDVQTALVKRPVWAACSTHDGEEEAVLKAHAKLLETQPDLCLILAPRHPERSQAVAALIAQHGLSHTRRSAKELPTAQVYLADTLGELGVWYAAAPFAFLGGSLLPIGGHNPFEAAHSGTAILSGTHTVNFAEAYESLDKTGGVRLVETWQDLHAAAQDWLSNEIALRRAQKATCAVIQEQSNQLDKIAKQLIDALDIDPQ